MAKKTTPTVFNKKRHQLDNHGGHRLRIWESKGRGKYSPHLLVKCGDCDNSFRIHYDDDCPLAELAGILASKEEWWTLFERVLGPRKPKR